jgi:hypothetical protein
MGCPYQSAPACPHQRPGAGEGGCVSERGAEWWRAGEETAPYKASSP